MMKLREKIERLAILAVAVPSTLARYIYEGARRDLADYAVHLHVDPVDERDVEIGELRAELEQAHRALGAEVNARLAVELENGRLNHELSVARLHTDDRPIP